MMKLLLGVVLMLGADGPAKRSAEGVTSLDVCADAGRLHLLVARRQDGSPAHAEYLYSNDAGATWSDPVRVGPDLPAPEIAKRGMDVQIAARGARVVAVWTAKGTMDRFGRGALVVAVSDDAGKTWRAGGNPADDGRDDLGRAFVDIAADSDGVFHLVWLDGRRADGKKGLIYSRSTDGGMKWFANQVLVPVTCECCWNTIVAGPSGMLHVLFRQYDPRDMGVVSSTDGGITWSAPTTVGNFRWNLDGCPHVGGGLARSDQGLYSIVWTGADESTKGVYVICSEGSNADRAKNQRVGDARAWHPDLAAAPDGRLVAVWDAYTDDGMAVFAVRSKDAGTSWSQPMRLNDPGTSATHPRVVFAEDSFVTLWTEKGPAPTPTRWRSKTINIQP